MSYNIIVSVAGQPANSPGVSPVYNFSVIDGVSPSVGLSLDNTVGINTYFWTITYKPPGSTAVLVGADTSTPSFVATADAYGTYRIECSLNGGTYVVSIGLSFRTPTKAFRIPAPQETIEFNGTEGWHESLFEFMDYVDGMSEVIPTTYWDPAELSGNDYVQTKDSRRIDVEAGTVSVPALVFGSDVGTGFYRPSSNQIGVSISAKGAVNFRRASGEIIIETVSPDDDSALFSIGHLKTAGSSQAEVRVGCVSTLAAGAKLTLGTDATVASTYPSEVALSALGGESTLDIAALSSNGGDCDLGLLAQTTGYAYIDIYSRSFGSEYAELYIRAKSTGEDAIVVVYAEGAAGDNGLVQIGNANTGVVGFLNSDINGAGSWAGTYIPITNSFSEVNDYVSNFGEVSIINALNQASSVAVSLNDAYLEGNTITPTSAEGTVTISVADTANVAGLTVNMADATNNPSGIVVNQNVSGGTPYDNPALELAGTGSYSAIVSAKFIQVASFYSAGSDVSRVALYCKTAQDSYATLESVRTEASRNATANVNATSIANSLIKLDSYGTGLSTVTVEVGSNSNSADAELNESLQSSIGDIDRVTYMASTSGIVTWDIDMLGGEGYVNWLVDGDKADIDISCETVTGEGNDAKIFLRAINNSTGDVASIELWSSTYSKIDIHSETVDFNSAFMTAAGNQTFTEDQDTQTGGTLTLTFGDSYRKRVNLSANITTVNFSGGKTGAGEMTVRFSSSGTYTLNGFGGVTQWLGSATPPFSFTSSDVKILRLYFVYPSSYYAVMDE